MKQPELTDELIMDLKAIKMRNLIYKKRFYKGNDSRELPKFFQVLNFIVKVIDWSNSHHRKWNGRWKID